MRRVLPIVFALISTVGSIRAEDGKPAQPNILWLIGEDMGKELGCYGDPEVMTPNLNRLAAQGVRFDRAYCTAPVCSASRSAFNTGMYQTTIGAHNHRSHRDDGYELPVGVLPLPDRLRAAGYFTANVVQFGAGFGFKGAGKVDWNFALDHEPYDSQEWADLRAHQPFYAQVNFQEAHRPYKAAQRNDPAKVTVPPWEPDTPVTRADRAARRDAIEELDRKVGRVLERLEADGLAQNTVVFFFGDNGQAQIRGKQFCYEEGLSVPLIVRWPEGLGTPPEGLARGSADSRLVELIDLPPTCLALAGEAKPSGMQGRILFGPNAEAARSYSFGARDRCDMTVFRFRTVRDDRFRYIRNFTPDRPFLQHNAYKENSYPAWNLLKELDAQGKLTPEQKVLTAATMPAEELYDLRADPDEVHNLVGSTEPEHQAAHARLKAELERWIAETHDQGATLEPKEVAEAQGLTKPGPLGDQTKRAGAAAKSVRAGAKVGSP
jgi:arylsulfatase A-like enzyme